MMPGKRFGALRGIRLLLGAVLLAAVGSSGCNTYSYFDVRVKLDDSFSPPRRGTIHSCHLFVTGAANGDFTLDRCSPPDSNDVGHFDYSTFSESGMVTFTLKLFQGVGERPDQQVGTGTTTLNISSGTTVTGDLTVMYTGMDPK
jgi:hypothetical protein